LLHEEGWPISLVVTAPDKPVGREKILTPSPVAQTADELGIAIAKPESLKDDAFLRTFAELRPDVAIVVAYGKLIPEAVLKIPRLGFINVHPSLLPAYRGPSPIRSAILDGCASTGVSIMVLDEQMDHGPILAQTSWIIPSGFDGLACESELASVGARLLTDTLPAYSEGTLMPQAQDHAAATFTKKFTRDDGRIDWSQPVLNIVNRIRALGDEPGTWTTLHDSTLRIHEAHAGTSHGAKPGTVVAADGTVGIVCGDGMLVLERIQPEAGKVMDARAFMHGHPDFIGSEVT
jgi:methionyl-tRNA formyltransferase